MGSPASGRKPAPIAPTTLAASRVLEYCASNDVRHTDVARELELGANTLRRFLTGERPPTLVAAVRIEALLSIPPREWFQPVEAVTVIEQE